MKLHPLPEPVRMVGEQLMAACSRISELDAFEVGVAIQPDFEILSLASLRQTPAVYLHEEHRIVVNASRFFDLPETHQAAVLMHEIAHAALKMLGDVRWGDDIWVDLHAARWGKVRDALVASRRASYGDDYADALGREPEIGMAEASRAMHAVRLRLLSGIG